MNYKTRLVNYLSKWFERDSSRDFEDDGVKYKKFKDICNGIEIEISLCFSAGEVYLSFSTETNMIEKYNMSKLDPYYAEAIDNLDYLADVYNGISENSKLTENMIAQWAADINVAIIKILELDKKIKPIVYLNAVDNEYYALQYERTCDEYGDEYYDEIFKKLDFEPDDRCIIKKLVVQD